MERVLVHPPSLTRHVPPTGGESDGWESAGLTNGTVLSYLWANYRSRSAALAGLIALEREGFVATLDHPKYSGEFE